MAALALVVALVAACPPVAQAHTDLLDTSPSAGSISSGPPSQVTLTFSEDVDPALSALSLQVDGQQLGKLSLTIGSEPGTLVGQVPNANLGLAEHSSWTVGYRVTSVDGHPIAGTVDFAVAAARPTSPASSPTPSPEDQSPAAAAPTSPADATTGTTSDTTSSNTSSSDDGSGDGSGQGWWVPAMVLLLVLLGAVAALRLGHAPEPEATEAPEAPEAPEPTRAEERESS